MPQQGMVKSDKKPAKAARMVGVRAFGFLTHFGTVGWVT